MWVLLHWPTDCSQKLPFKRIASSSFKRVCSRRSNYESVYAELHTSKHVQMAAMKPWYCQWVWWFSYSIHGKFHWALIISKITEHRWSMPCMYSILCYHQLLNVKRTPHCGAPVPFVERLTKHKKIQTQLIWNKLLAKIIKQYKKLYVNMDALLNFAKYPSQLIVYSNCENY